VNLNALHRRLMQDVLEIGNSEYGLSAERISDVRMWAQAWADDINQRIYRDTLDEDD
jgi:hypothetical protein